MTVRPVSVDPSVRVASFVMAVMLVLCGFVVGEGAYGLPIAFLGFMVQGAMALVALARKDKSRARVRVVAVGVYLLGGAAIVGIGVAQVYHARQGAAQVLAACRRYESTTGQLPTRLEDLVPAYLARVPRARLSLMCADYRYYRTSAGCHLLSVTEVCPFGRAVYDFEADSWTYLD